MTSSIGAVILAGGHGSRLGGVNKALLEIGGRVNIERVLGAVTPLCSERVIIANDRALAAWCGDATLVLDEEPHAGVLPALAQGLRALSTELALAVACDMPFLNRALLAELLELAEHADVVIPEIGGRLEPMHAVYRRAVCEEAIRRALAGGARRMIAFLDDLHVVRVPEEELRSLDPELLSFFNTNTPEDLRHARELAKTRGW